jgi:hypothetical protein
VPRVVERCEKVRVYRHLVVRVNAADFHRLCELEGRRLVNLEYDLERNDELRGQQHPMPDSTWSQRQYTGIHLYAVSFMLRLEHDLLDSLDPLVPCGFSVRRKRIVALGGADLELAAVQGITRGGVLERNVAFGKVRVLSR